jgi:hypothetical protein
VLGENSQHHIMLHRADILLRCGRLLNIINILYNIYQKLLTYFYILNNHNNAI